MHLCSDLADTLAYGCDLALGIAQDPNARNCHGYRKFVKRSVLENPNSGYLVADTIIIKYTIELVVSSGGALARAPGTAQPKLPSIQVRWSLHGLCQPTCDIEWLSSGSCASPCA